MARLANPDLAVRRRQQILEAAEMCFRRRGFHQATMQEICAEARISPGALYRYFNSKSDIIAAISEEKHREGEAEFISLFEEIGFVDALMAVVARFMDKFGQDEFGSLFCDIAGEAARDPVLAARLAEIERHAEGRLAEAVAKAQQRGAVDPNLDPHEAAQTLGTFLDGFAMQIARQPRRDPATVLHQFRSLAERYLAPRS